MTVIEAKCQFCGSAVRLEIDQDYDALEDPQKLIRLRSCNHCADLKYRQRRITESLEEIAHAVRITDDQKALAGLRERAEKVLKAYVRVVSEWERLESIMDWDDGILENLMQNPKKVSGICHHIWAAARQVKAQKKLI